MSEISTWKDYGYLQEYKPLVCKQCWVNPSDMSLKIMLDYHELNPRIWQQYF